MILLILYQATVAPFRIAFLNVDKMDLAHIVFEIFIEILFFLDIILALFTPYARINREFQTKFKWILIEYFKTFLFTDLLAAFPSQIILYKLNSKDIGNQSIEFKMKQRQFEDFIHIFNLVRTVKYVKYWNSF